MLNTKSIDLELSSSQYLSITDALQTGLDITGDLTIEAWIKLESFGTSQYIVGKYIDSGGTQRSYIFYLLSTGGLRLILSANGSAIQLKATSGTFSGSDVGVWAHVAVTFNATTGDCKFYRDGVADGGTYTFTLGSIFNSTAKFTIGARADADTGFFDGLIDEVMVWSEVRTPTQIAESYNSGNGKIYLGTETNLQGYWRLEDDLLDETSNNNDLTNNNSAVFSVDVPFAGSSPAGGSAKAQAIII